MNCGTRELVDSPIVGSTPAGATKSPAGLFRLAGLFARCFSQMGSKRCKSLAAADLFGGSAALPAVQQQPCTVYQCGDNTKRNNDFQVETAQKLPEAGQCEQQRVAVNVLPGDQVHHADGLPGQLQLHGAHHVALLHRRADRIRQVEVFLGHTAVTGGGQQGHHAVGGVKLQGVGVGGVLHRDLGQCQVGVQCSLDGKAVEHPVDQVRGLVKGRAAVGIAEVVTGVGAAHHAEDIGGTVLVGPGDVALLATVVLEGGHVAHAALHGAAVVFAAAGFIQGGILADEDRRRTVLFLCGHREGGRAGNFHKGVKAHQVAQDQVHVHGACHVAAVDAAGVGPGAGDGSDALGQGVHLAHPSGQVAAGECIGQAHGSFVCVAGHHGVDGLAVGEGLVGAHVRVAGVIDIVRDGKRHLEGVVQMVGIIGQQQGDGHVFGQAAGRHLLGTVLVINDDVGIRVDDVGAFGLHLVDGGGVEHGPGGQHEAAEQDGKGQNQCKNTFHVDNSFKKR